MNRPYTAHSPYSLSPTERIPSHGDDGGETVDLDRGRYDEYPGLERYEDLEDYEDYDDYEPIDRRWIWIAGVAGAILLVASLFGKQIGAKLEKAGAPPPAGQPPPTPAQAPPPPPAG